MEDTVIERPRYLQRLKTFQDKDLIKVVTGVRRCGKSTLLDLMKEDLLSQDVPSDRILSFKMESMEYDGLDDYRELYRIVMDCARGLTHPYLFFDELQDVPGWERAINSLRVDLDCDIYITGSNAHLLSSELSTLISGRYIEVEMRPLTTGVLGGSRSFRCQSPTSKRIVRICARSTRRSSCGIFWNVPADEVIASFKTGPFSSASAHFSRTTWETRIR